MNPNDFENMSNAELDDYMLARETGAGLLARIERFMSRYVVYPSQHACVAHVLRVAHTHLMNAWFTTPRLALMSAEKESGKTRALEVTELLASNPLLSVNISPAALVRKVAAESEYSVTILYDEIDGLFGTAGREEGNVDVRSIMNSGYRRGASVYRCYKQHGTHEVEELPCFAPVAVAGLRSLPDTLASRSIIIGMMRRAPDQQVEQFRLRKVKPFAENIRRALHKWCCNIADEIENAEPDMPEGIVDRGAECWEPLLAVADRLLGATGRNVHGRPPERSYRGQ